MKIIKFQAVRLELPLLIILDAPFNNRKEVIRLLGNHDAQRGYAIKLAIASSALAVILTILKIVHFVLVSIIA